ncbi:TetR family transcriptional regulator [Schumannella luteola]
MSTTRSNRGPAAAAENRAALIRAAAEVFSEQGVDAPLSAIAKRAGVGQASLYRHFRSRGELAFAAFESNLDDLQEIVDRGGSLSDVLTVVAEQLAEISVLIDLAASLVDDPHLAAFEGRMRGILDAVIDEGRASGTVPADYTTGDIILSIGMLSAAARAGGRDHRRAAIARALELLRIRL